MTKSCSTLALVQRVGFCVLALPGRLFDYMSVVAQQQPYPSLAPISTQCIEEFVTLNGNGTELDRLFQNMKTLNSSSISSSSSSSSSNSAQTTCVVVPVKGDVFCTRDFREINSSAFQALCEHGRQNSGSGDATTINATMIKYDILEACQRWPYTFDVLVNRPLCIPSACGDGVGNVLDIKELYNDHYAQPVRCNAAIDPQARLERGACWNETWTLRYFVDFLFPYSDAIDPCQEGAAATTDQSSCVIDYRLANTSPYQAICTSLDGIMLRHDVLVQCTLDNGSVKTVTVLSELQCVGPSCTAPEAPDPANYVPNGNLGIYFDGNVVDASCTLRVMEASNDTATATTSSNGTTSSATRIAHCNQWATSATVAVVIAAVVLLWME